MMTRAVVLAVVLGLAVPTFAEDQMQDWTGGQAAPAPAPVENQVPADFQPGVFDMQGNFMGNTVEEANAKANAEYHAQPHSIWESTPYEQHDYFDPATGQMTGVFLVNGKPVTTEEFFANQERINKKHNAVMRDVLGGADDPAVDAQTKGAISQTLAVIEKSEREQAADLQRQREDAKRYVPARTLRSFEATGSQTR